MNEIISYQTFQTFHRKTTKFKELRSTLCSIWWKRKHLKQNEHTISYLSFTKYKQARCKSSYRVLMGFFVRLFKISEFQLFSLVLCHIFALLCSDICMPHVALVLSNKTTFIGHLVKVNLKILMVNFYCQEVGMFSYWVCWGLKDFIHLREGFRKHYASQHGMFFLRLCIANYILHNEGTNIEMFKCTTNSEAECFLSELINLDPACCVTFCKMFKCSHFQWVSCKSIY